MQLIKLCLSFWFLSSMRKICFKSNICDTYRPLVVTAGVRGASTAETVAPVNWTSPTPVNSYPSQLNLSDSSQLKLSDSSQLKLSDPVNSHHSQLNLSDPPSPTPVNWSSPTPNELKLSDVIKKLWPRPTKVSSLLTLDCFRFVRKQSSNLLENLLRRDGKQWKKPQRRTHPWVSGGK